jgi:hypothetical protein
LKLKRMPETMSTTYYRLLYKKDPYNQAHLEQGLLDGTPRDPRILSNWRPIALIPCIAKIFSSYIASNLKHLLEEVVSNSQAAFVPGRAIHDVVMLIRMIIHEDRVNKIPAGLLFIDFTAAYDYISQDYIMTVLRTMQFPTCFLDAIEMTMYNQKGKVIVNQDLSPEFPVDNGGKQGDGSFIPPHLYPSH